MINTSKLSCCLHSESIEFVNRAEVFSQRNSNQSPGFVNYQVEFTSEGSQFDKNEKKNHSTTCYQLLEQQIREGTKQKEKEEGQEGFAGLSLGPTIANKYYRSPNRLFSLFLVSPRIFIAVMSEHISNYDKSEPIECLNYSISYNFFLAILNDILVLVS